MCADSLASGCLFSKQSYVRNRKLFFFGAPHCDLGGASILAPLDAILPSWGHPGRHWEQQGGHVGIQGRISVDFGMIWDPILRAFPVPMARNLVLFSGSFQCRFRHRFVGRNLGTSDF